MEENFKRSITKRRIAMTATETIAVPEFESRLSVFRVRANFAAPYRKCKFFYLDRVNLKSRKGFLKHVQNVCKGWPNGIYFLKLVVMKSLMTKFEHCSRNLQIRVRNI